MSKATLNSSRETEVPPSAEDEMGVGERSNFKKILTHTQDHGDGIATRGESVRPRTLVDRKRKR